MEGANFTKTSCENTKVDAIDRQRKRVIFFIIIVLNYIILNKSKEIFYSNAKKMN